MAAFDHTENEPRATRRIPLALRIKRLLPRSLYGRTLLIIVVPTLITLAAATFVFFDRHWYTVTNRLCYAVAGDIAVSLELIQKSSNPESMAAIVRLASDKMDLFINFAPGTTLPTHAKESLNPLRNILRSALNDRLSYPFQIDMRHAPETIAIMVGAPEGVYTVVLPQRRVYTPTTEVFIVWMVGSSILLSAIALMFMRNQIRPIRRLADAAEAIGKGHDVPDFKIEGASEVRQAATALLVMRDRLRRQITQRTTMLAGVSHDLRTPLTRMRLQLALMAHDDATRELMDDVAEMETMLAAYLAFARGEEAEPAQPVLLAELLNEVVNNARRQNPNVTLIAPPDVTITLRRQAMKRCLTNLVGNALRYGKKAAVEATLGDHLLTVTVDDDGPGIAIERREDMFRPFTRLEESRNATTGGVGLGLTIARDIARFHGGDVVLEESPMGGLRARVWLPV
ncbi:MAG: HAMP domain-containing protein [Alphaproteobacteria bacterium]|nr:HAMP domain-containing protein [Alphaproteobacteria bacterium]MBV8547911.1 HAMP domain-containing protein [Alphaproteobacteria bacterium]